MKKPFFSNLTKKDSLESSKYSLNVKYISFPSSSSLHHWARVHVNLEGIWHTPCSSSLRKSANYKSYILKFFIRNCFSDPCSSILGPRSPSLPFQETQFLECRTNQLLSQRLDMSRPASARSYRRRISLAMGKVD